MNGIKSAVIEFIPENVKGDFNSLIIEKLQETKGELEIERERERDSVERYI